MPRTERKVICPLNLDVEVVAAVKREAARRGWSVAQCGREAVALWLRSLPSSVPVEPGQDQP